MSVRQFILLTIVVPLLITSCTRSRTTAEPTVAADIAEPVVITGSIGTDGSASNVTNGEPESLVILDAPNSEGSATETPTPAPTVTRATINYTVQSGDTLSSVAIQFGTTMERVRQLNRLIEDDLYVGQILQMPYTEGVTAEGIPTATPEPYRHVVAEGSNLSIIAESYGVSEVAIMEANELSNPNSIYVGQSLIIPGYATAVSTTPSTTAGSQSDGQTSVGTTAETALSNVQHIVQPGDTLYAIAEIYGVDAAVLIDANNIANGNQLRVGQQLEIPGVTQLDAARARGRVHVIQSGENLSAIANLYGVTAEEIITLNGIDNPDTIYVGQQLVIPGQ